MSVPNSLYTQADTYACARAYTLQSLSLIVIAALGGGHLAIPPWPEQESGGALSCSTTSDVMISDSGFVDNKAKVGLSRICVEYMVACSGHCCAYANEEI